MSIWNSGLCKAFTYLLLHLHFIITIIAIITQIRIVSILQIKTLRPNLNE